MSPQQQPTGIADKGGERDRKPGLGGRQGEGGPQNGRATPGNKPADHKLEENKPDTLTRPAHGPAQKGTKTGTS